MPHAALFATLPRSLRTSQAFINIRSVKTPSVMNVLSLASDVPDWSPKLGAFASIASDSH